MAYVDWRISGPKLGGCNCHYGCPCEFNALPAYGFCEGMEAMEIEAGWFDDVRLDGVRFAARFHWPGAVHEGRGTVQGFIDDSATAAQRDALGRILAGEEQAPTTIFNIYGSTIETELDTVFAPIEFAWDADALTGRLRVEGYLDFTLEPIRNPVTGAVHRAAIRLPHGFEFREAWIASSTFESTGDMAYAHAKRYGQIFYASYGPDGIIDGEPGRIAMR